MDVAAVLATQVVATLAPALSYLIRGTAREVGDQATKSIGRAAWVKASRLWDKLRPEVDKNQRTSEVVQELSAAPEDEDLQAVLRVELRKILERDPVLRGEIAKLLNTGTTTRVSVRGKKNVAAGRDITGSTIVHGDYLRASLSETEAQIAAFANAGVLLKLLMVVGVLVMLAGFAVFMSFIFSGANADPSQDVDITPAAIGMGMMLSGGILSSLAYIVARLADPT